MNIIKAANDLNYAISEVKDNDRKHELERLMKDLEEVVAYPDDMLMVEIEQRGCLYHIINRYYPFSEMTDETFTTLNDAIEYCSERSWYAERY